MRKLKIFFVILVLLSPSQLFAAPVSWDFASGILQPLQSAWNAIVKGSSFQATSTTAVNSFPKAVFTQASSTEYCFVGGSCISSWPTSGGSGGGSWSTTTSTHTGRLINYPNNTTDIVVIGGTATTTGFEYYFDPNTQKAQLGVANTASTTVMGNVYLPSLSQGFAYFGTDRSLLSVSTSTLAGHLFPFTSYGAATSTVFGFTGGMFSTASSTFSSALRLPSLSQGVLYTGSTGLIGSTATGTVSSSGGITTTGNRDVLGGSLSISCDVASGSQPGCLSSANWTTFNNKQDALVSGTNIKTVNGNSLLGAGDLTVSGGSGNVSTSTNETMGRLAYWTTTSGTPAKLGDVATSSVTINAPLTSAGTPGYVVGGSGWTLDVDDIGAADLAAADFGSFTCNGTTCTVDNTAITNAMLANSTISGIALGSNLADLTATNSTLTFSGTYNGGTARTIGLNLGNANTWTAKQNFFGAASSTLLSANYAQFGGTATTTLTSVGKVGVASSSPFARLGVETQAGDIWGFAVGSSTKSLLSVSTEGFGTTTLAGLNISATATSTSNVGFNITNGCYAIAGTCLSGGSGLSSYDAWTHPLPTWSATSSALMVGTTTNPWAAFTISSSTKPQLSLSSGAGFLQWVFRSVGNYFYLATSTTAGTATSTVPALTIDPNGKFGIGTSSPFKKFSVTGDVQVDGGSAASSTVYIYSSAASKGGSIILEDTDGAGCTEVSALNGVLTAATVTCPSE